MTFKELIIFVEGEYDELFANSIIVKKFEQTMLFDHISVFKWCKKERDLVNKYVISLHEMNCEDNSYDYIFLTDLDSPIFRCVSAKKIKVIENFPDISINNIVIVVNEIEGWYLAGISDKTRKKLGIKSDKFHLIDPNTVLKEIFEIQIKPKKFSKLEFMLEILRIFDTEVAKTRNQSFDYFFNKYLVSA
jgi:hypothetical protein